MQNSIQVIKSEILEVEEETQYMENFRLPYIQSERAPYFLGHENGVLYDTEYVVRLRQKRVIEDGIGDTVSQMQANIDDPILISSPKESRAYFFKDKLHELQIIGIE